MVKDILFDVDGDLAFSNGDLVVGESTNQHKQDILMAAPGHYRQSPLIGADISQYLNDAIDLGAIKNAMRADSMVDVKVKLTNGILTIDGEYE